VDLHNKLLAIIEARMAAYADERSWAAGESTGLIVTKESWGNTDSREAQVDLGLVKQIQSLHEQIVKEQRDWDTSVSVKHMGRVDHVHRNPDLKQLTDDELDALERIAHRVHQSEAV
jgi:demethoxyubiquinone hydroxylase (CLK1/Coq7/Cat5 family)